MIEQAVANARTKRALLPQIALGGSMGVGAIVALAALDVVRSQPMLAMGLLDKWGAPFALTVIIVGVVNQRMGQMIQIGKENAQAVTSMAGAIDRIATRDNMRELEMETLVGRLNGRYDEIREAQLETQASVTEILRRLPKEAVQP